MAESEKGAWTNVDPHSPASDAAGQIEDQRKTGGLLQRLKGTKVDPDELGRRLFEESQQFDEAQLERDAVKVRRKLDFLLLPMVRTSTWRLEDKKLVLTSRLDVRHIYDQLSGQADPELQ